MLTIKINPAFYDAECIRETLNDFNEVCTGSFDGTTLTLHPKSDEIESLLKYEFLNYTLVLMKNKALV